MKMNHFVSALAFAATIATGIASADVVRLPPPPTPLPSSEDPDSSDMGVNIAIGFSVAVVAGAALFFIVQKRLPKKK